ncbi:Flp pilus assembly protein CpaB [Phenylobacterium montanum]|uniref:Flp pilus assembly protein CpaB n=1 Tax=Phenylobacterium montanum TaxID=2823693 RepID=A0A975FW35_9CAUL|nr:Flp pilus assembly protein CpaB [Caulobacter sp. S6]QUD86017.1 Flp pilus assembly protein CpaB [Caulobacter sp. S6]
MRSATIISLGASAVFAVGAVFVARIWMPPHPAHAQSPAAIKPAVSDGVSVVVASVPISYGSKLDARYLKVIKLPAATAPPGAFASVNDLMGQPGGVPLALADFAPQDPILPGKITGPGERQTLAALIDPNMRAYTIGVTDVSGGGGHVMPGDRVDVVLTRDVTPAGTNSSPATRRIASEVVLQDVRVLGVDQNANPTTTQAVVARTSTLEVSAQDAVRLALAAQTGSLSLALRRTGEQAMAPVKALIGGEAPTISGSGKPAGKRAASKPTEPVQATVTVVQGEVATKQSVAFDKAGAGF